eukprot:1411746-Karenia_brevis.AAC.1
MCPDSPMGTCTVGGQARKYDYFVLRPDLQHYATVKSMNIDSFPHTPTVLELQASAKPHYRLVQCAPRALPIQQPIGCSPKPQQWAQIPSSFSCQEEATVAWQGVITKVEDEVLAANDLHGAAAEPY